MTRFNLVAVMSLTVALATGCSENERKEEAVVPGFSGGCAEGFIVYVQDQFEPGGSSLRNDVDEKSQGDVVFANKRLIVTGWFDSGEAVYPDNPDGIKGEVWYYVPKLRGWVSDAGVRSVKTFRGQKYRPRMAASRSEDCELARAD